MPIKGEPIFSGCTKISPSLRKNEAQGNKQKNCFRKNVLNHSVLVTIFTVGTTASSVFVCGFDFQGLPKDRIFTITFYGGPAAAMRQCHQIKLISNNNHHHHNWESVVFVDTF